MSFNVTEEIERFVYIYVITARKTHIIDTGVAGTERIIEDYLKNIGRKISDIESVLLTHSHPDHIGSAFAIKELSNCTVYAPEAEMSWIENIDKQFSERPIPNFYSLVNKSVAVDKALSGSDILMLEDGVTIKVIDSRGHSAGSLSFLWIEQGELFTGDSIPVPGEIPIYVSSKDSIETLERLLALDGVKKYLPAWDDVYDKEKGVVKIKKSLDFLLLLNNTVKKVWADSDDKDAEKIYARVCASLKLDHLLQNPLFKTSVYSNIKEMNEKNTSIYY